MQNNFYTFKIYRNGFTLAEVLITLVIIGVVAAMTIPTVIAKHQKEQTVNQLKQVFSQFNQAARLSIPEYGDPVTWDYSLSGDEFLKKYLKFVKVKEMPHDQSQIMYKRSDGANETAVTNMYNGAPIFVLNSGALIYSANNTPSASYAALKKKCYAVDLNGLKGPNRFGRDAFFLCLDGEHGTVLPHRADDGDPPYIERTREELINGSAQSYRCNKNNGRGMWCAALIIQDGWQIKDDYPW